MSRALRAEAAGTFGLVFLGTGACVVDAVTGGALGVVGIGAVFGLAVYAMAAVFGAQMNPAASLALCLSGRQPWRELAPRAGAQLLGAFAASLALKALFGAKGGSLGATLPHYGTWTAFAAEFAMTFLLLLAVLRAPAALGPVVAGVIVGLEATLGGPVSGASMNPARSLAPAVVSSTYSGLWIYLIAPLMGACAAVSSWATVPRLNRGGGG